LQPSRGARDGQVRSWWRADQFWLETLPRGVIPQRRNRPFADLGRRSRAPRGSGDCSHWCLAQATRVDELGPLVRNTAIPLGGQQLLVI
jgi:hypothetical protein